MTDLLPVLITAVALSLALLKAGRTNARLERENAWLRSRVHSMRKQISVMVERPF